MLSLPVLTRTTRTRWSRAAQQPPTFKIYLSGRSLYATHSTIVGSSWGGHRSLKTSTHRLQCVCDEPVTLLPPRGAALSQAGPIPITHLWAGRSAFSSPRNSIQIPFCTSALPLELPPTNKRTTASVQGTSPLALKPSHGSSKSQALATHGLRHLTLG